MKKRRAKELRVGIVGLAGIIVAAMAILLIGSERRLFSPKTDYYAEFDFVAGLTEGSPVRLRGLAIGEVDKIVLPTDPKENFVVVRLKVERTMKSRIRTNTEAAIKSLGVLGDKYIELSTPISADAGEILEDGSRIKAASTVDLETLMGAGEDLAANFVEISESLKIISAQITSGEGTVGRLLMDDKLGIEVVEKLEASLDSIAAVVKRLEDGEGLLGRLTQEDEETLEIVANLKEVTASFAMVVSTMESDGLLALLGEDSGQSARESLENFRVTSENLKELTSELIFGEGALVRLINDPVLAEEVLSDFREIMSNLSLITSRVESGDGTVGQLLNDPSVYQGLKDVVGGVNESTFLRWYIKKKQKKGEKAREEQKTQPADSEVPPGSD